MLKTVLYNALRPTYCRDYIKAASPPTTSPPFPKSVFNEKYVEDISKEVKATDKISIIGAGQVGVSCAAFILSQRLTSHLVISDVRKEWVQAEVLDFLHASVLLDNPKIEACTDFSKTVDSKFVILSAGKRPDGLSRLDVAKATAEIMADIVPKLIKLSPNATLIVSANPPDVMAAFINKMNKIPKHRCISCGCHLDSLRFRYFIAKRLGVSPASVDAFVIGEHGDSAVPVWSGVTVGGISLMRIIPNIGTDCDPEHWKDVHKAVIDAGRSVSEIKHYTNWGVSLAVVNIIASMIENSGHILSVGSDVKGIMGIEDNVVLSMPSLLSKNGVLKILELPLTKFEMEALQKSSEILLEAQCALKM